MLFLSKCRPCLGLPDIRSDGRRPGYPDADQSPDRHGAGMTALVLSGIGIRQDAEGRYCLNDLHKAAGGESKDKPADWLQLKATKGLADELLTSGFPEISPLSVKVGRYGGTYAAKEMIYAYAMWISPAFHLKVIRAYDQLVTAPPPQPVVNLADPAALRGLLLSYTEKVMELEQTVQEQAPKVQALARIAEGEGSLCLTDAARTLQCGPRDLSTWLLSLVPLRFLLIGIHNKWENSQSPRLIKEARKTICTL